MSEKIRLREINYLPALSSLEEGEIPIQRTSRPSRDVNTPVFHSDEDNVYYLGFPEPVFIGSAPTDTAYIVTPGDIGRPDNIAYKFHGTPNTYWYFLFLNGLVDFFYELYPSRKLRIPDIQRMLNSGVDI